MGKKSKKASDRSTAYIDLGRDRKNRIAAFRAKKTLQGQNITSIEEAVNLLVDAGLEAETLNA